MTTIQISNDLRDLLVKRKLYEKETFEEVIWDLVEDSMELSEQAKKDIKEAEEDIKAGRVHRWEDVKRELGIDV